MRIRVALCLLAASLLATAQAQSDKRGPGWDFGVDVIYQDSTDLTFEGGSTLALDDDLMGQARLVEEVEVAVPPLDGAGKTREDVGGFAHAGTFSRRPILKWMSPRTSILPLAGTR